MMMEARDHEKTQNDFGVSQSTPRSLAENFCADTSAHGLGKILPVKHWARSVFWSLLFIGAVVVLCLQIRALFNKYQSRPLTTLLTVERKGVRYFSDIDVRAERTALTNQMRLSEVMSQSDLEATGSKGGKYWRQQTVITLAFDWTRNMFNIITGYIG